MFGRLFSKEETNTALVLAFGGTIMLLVANGSGSVSLKRSMSRALSNPVPRVSQITQADAPLPILPSQIAA